MKNLICTVSGFALLPPNTVHKGGGEYDMLVEGVYPFIKEKLVEVDETGKVVFKKTGYKKKARTEK